MPSRSPRFTVKALLVAVTLFAIIVATYPRVRRYIAWRSVRAELVKWVEGLERKPGKVEDYVHLDASFDPRRPNAAIGSWYQVSTAEGERNVEADGRVTWYVSEGTSVDPIRFFVIPPGKWVDSVDEIIFNWDRHRDQAVQY